MSKITSLALIRDCINRLEKIEIEQKIIANHETRLSIPQDKSIQLKIADILEDLRNTKELVEERNSMISAGQGKEIYCIKLTNDLRHKIIAIETALDSLGLSDAKADRGIVSLFKSRHPGSKEDEMQKQQKLELENLGHILREVKDLFSSQDLSESHSVEQKKLRRTTLKKALRKGFTEYNIARKDLGEMEKSIQDESGYGAQIQAIEKKEQSIDRSIDFLIAGARNLAEYGKNFREEIGTQTEMLISSSEHVTKSLGRMGVLKKRLDRIIGDRSSQNIFLSSLFFLVFLGLVGYLVYELVTFFV
ncbi:hypothetical protein XU18_1130 [Perkinsela sp. CCAP 1560/4]|nr:hypothetical protein XU18_1130 [Perkinsela sp. CCAP 1560/4]|eukprot:KNH08321.1 hypothetical protein XU18_1130 [Perkinsela sp. CCAP 1560/4]